MTSTVPCKRLLVCIAFGVLNLFAQDEVPTKVTNQNRVGDLPFSATVGTDIEHVDIASGNLVVKIPIVSLPGRGIDGQLLFVYNGKYFVAAKRVDYFPPPCHGCLGEPKLREYWATEDRPYYSPRGIGWTVSEVSIDHTTSPRQCYSSSYYTVYDNSHYILTDQTGAKHVFVAKEPFGSNGCPISDPQGPDVGAAGMWANLSTSAFLASDGSRPGWQDANGNYLSHDQGLIDTAGRRVYRAAVDPNDPNTTNYTVYDTNGQEQTYRVTVGDIALKSSFNTTYDSGIMGEYVNGGRSVIKSILLPNGKSYEFEYELPDSSGATFGGLTKVVLPTGAYVEYEWETLSAGDKSFRYVRKRTVHPDGTAAKADVWEFAYSGDSESPSVLVTYPADDEGHKNHAVYSAFNGAVTYAAFYNGDATGTPVISHTISYKWDEDPFYDSDASLWTYDIDLYEPTYVGLRPTKIVTALDNGKVSKKEFDYEEFQYTYHPRSSFNGYRIAKTYTTSRGNVSEIREYDWGADPDKFNDGQALKRRTSLTYYHTQKPEYKLANIVDKVFTRTVSDGLSNKWAETQFEYDTTTLESALGAPNHDYSPRPYRGNVSLVKNWRSTDGALLTTTYTYDELGNIRTIKDPGRSGTGTDGHTTTWEYGTISTCIAPETANARVYPTTVTNSLGHETELEWYTCTGKLHRKVDPNQATTEFTYDLFGRELTRTTPHDGTTTGLITHCYSDTDSSCAQANSLFTVRTTTRITTGTDLVVDELHDGIGRVTQTQRSDPIGRVYVDTGYDANGRVKSVSNPYRTQNDETYGSTTTTYDVLGRPRIVTLPDGNVYETQYLGNRTTSIDQTSRQRRNYSDAFGRLIRVDEPAEGVTPGTPTIPAVAATGNVGVSGSVQSIPAAPASGSVTISGSVKRVQQPDCPPRQICYLYDSGSVRATVGGFSAAVSYSQGSTSTSVANGLRDVFNNGATSPVSATVSGSTIYLTAKQAGGSGNYSLSTSVSYDNGNFSSASFTASRSGATLTGGVDTIYDRGTATITVNGHSVSVPYGQGDTATILASRLASASYADVYASPAGTTVSLQSRIPGLGGNYPLSAATATADPAHFASGSFALSLSGATLAGGFDATPGTPDTPTGVISIETPAITEYGYDPLGNLTSVTQQGGPGTPASEWRSRIFTYNSLSQLIRAENPETGRVVNGIPTNGVETYGYDSCGNLETKTDARQITTTYSYDSLHRLSGKTYSDSTPAASFTYDRYADGTTVSNGIGRLVRSEQGCSGSRVQAYFPSGHVQSEWQWTPQNCGSGWNTSYTYTAVGGVETYSNSQDVSFTNHYTSAAQVDQITSTLSDAQHPGTIVNDVVYTPSGALDKLTYGNGVKEERHYNQRLQPEMIRIYDPAQNTDLMKLAYGFYDAGKNDGNVVSWSSTSSAQALNFDRTFAYDDLNRLRTMWSSQCSLNWRYDFWGNRLAQENAGGNCFSSNYAYNVLNQISGDGYQHDPAGGGNLTVAPSPSGLGYVTYQYDAENRLGSVNQTDVIYSYDAAGQRTRKVSAAETRNYVRSGDGSVIAEINQNNAWETGYVYLNGELVGQYKDATTYFVHRDHLGTTRLLTRMDKSVADALDYYPFGEQVGGDTGTTHKFTGKERDAETGLDYFGARYYGSNIGRWMSPDWAAKPTTVPYADFGDPQTLNLYGYVRNNPLFRADPDGHCGAGIWECISEAVTTVEVKVTIGLGFGEKVKVGPGEAKLQAAYKGSLVFSYDKVSAAESADLGATAGSKTGPTVGLGISASRTVGSVNTNTGEVTGREPASGEKTVGISVGDATVGAGQERLALGTEVGVGPLGGGEASITRDGAAAFRQALVNVKNIVLPPTPPMPPPPPPPPDPTKKK